MPHRVADRCYYCDRPAEYQCDFVLELRAYLGGPAAGMTDEDFVAALLSPAAVRFRACDRPLCDAHRVHRGHIFFCGGGGEIVSLDFCPGHARGPDWRPPYRPLRGGQAS